MKVKPNTSMIQPISMSKKQRTNRPRKNRTHISPILYDDVSVDNCHSLSSTLTSNSTLTLHKKRKLDDLSFPNDTVSETSCVESKTKEVVLENEGVESSYNDLACREELCYGEVVVSSEEFSEEVYGSSTTTTTTTSSSEFEFSDYTPSIFFDTGTEFSEKTETDESSKSFELLVEFRRLFLPSSHHAINSSSSFILHHSNFIKFEDEGDEESYKLLRERERKQVNKHDYVEAYKSNTEFGQLVFHQRLQMVHWIVEQTNANEYQQETMFLGVSLLDRFLSKGFFKSKRNLQIVGIACLTLATRIEENQPYNTIRQKIFCIGNNEYSRYEVVAMEWLVQEVLNFQCYMPTISNFMWFYLKAAKADAEMEKKARYLAVMAQSDHEQVAYWPSTVAAGLVILACVENNDMDSYQRVIEVHVRTKENDLHECIKNLEWLLQYVN